MNTEKGLKAYLYSLVVKYALLHRISHCGKRYVWIIIPASLILFVWALCVIKFNRIWVI